MDTNELIDELAKLTTSDDVVSGLERILEKPTDSFSLLDVKNTFLELLLRNTPNINLLVVKCIAEITKNADQRGKFSNSDILEKLMDMLQDALTRRDFELTSQLCRALGNIFYSNDDSRNIIFHQDEGKGLIKLLEVSNSDIKSLDELVSFSKVRSGVLSNYLLGNEELSQKAIENGVLELIKSRIEDALNPFNDSLAQHLLPILSILTEQVSDLIFKPDIIQSIIRIFKQSTNSDVVESCLELLQCQAESDDIKFLLARESVCEHIFDSIEKYKTFEGSMDAESLVKLSCDLIVLILTGDEAMHYLGKTPFLLLIQKWLDSKDEYVVTTSVLALGNFARTDNHCIQMVNNDILKKLMEILQKSSQQEEQNLRLQHALLSAIKNLVIPKENKVRVIQSGLIEIILPMLKSDQQPVAFKVLGTLRMLIDGHAELALKFLNDDYFLRNCVEWAKKSPDMVGVTSEASRLLAWLVKNALRGNNQQKLNVLLSVDGSVDVLVKMLLSSHVIMQNEGVLALTLIASSSKEQLGQLEKMLIESNISSAISDFIDRIAETDRITNEIIDNLSTFITVLKSSEVLKKYLDENRIDEKAIPRIQELATL